LHFGLLNQNSWRSWGERWGKADAHLEKNMSLAQSIAQRRIVTTGEIYLSTESLLNRAEFHFVKAVYAGQRAPRASKR